MKTNYCPRIAEALLSNNDTDASCKTNCLQVETNAQGTRKHVRIAEYSELRLIRSPRYQMRPSSQPNNMSYTKREIKSFKAKASTEALRIRSFISEQLEHHRSTKDAVQHTMNLGVLKCHVIGIEHLVIDEGAQQQARARHAHMTYVLNAQRKMQEKCHGKVDVTRLAKFAAMSSAKSVEKARQRASTYAARRKALQPEAASTHPSVLASRRATQRSTGQRAHGPVAHAA